MEEKKYFVCKTSRMLEYLVSKGFNPTHREVDFNNPRYFVWKFEETPAFIEARDAWFEQVKKLKK